MAKKKPRPEPEPFSFSAWLARTGMMIVAGVLILAVIAVLFAKTDGFRSIVEREVESQLGLHVSVGDSGLLWNGDVRLQNLRTVGDDSVHPYGVEIVEARLRLSLLNLVRRGEVSVLRRILLRDCQVTFSPDEGGELQPKRLNGVTDWLARWGGLALPSTEDGSRRTSLFHPADPGETEAGPGDSGFNWKQTRITVLNADMRWLDAEGNAIVSVHDLDFTAVPIRFPTRDATHLHLVVGLIELADTSRVNDMDVELLQTGASYLVLNLAAVRRAGASEPPQTTPRRSVDMAPAAVAADLPAARPEPVGGAAPESTTAPVDRAAFIRAELERAVAD